MLPMPTVSTPPPVSPVSPLSPLSPVSPVRRTRLAPLAAVIICSALLAACSADSTPAPSPAPANTHAAGVPYLTRSGTGSATLPTIALPSKWTVVWHFSCTKPSTRRQFKLKATRSGAKATTVTNQTGLEGGGYHPFTTSGTYTFAVATTCSWKVLVGTAEMQTIPTTVPKPAN